MIAILIRGRECKNVNNDEQLSNDLAAGWRQLTDAEITAAGMTGHEHLVCPINTTVGADGSITFTPPSTAALTEQLFSALRADRDAKLRDNYDPAIAQLARQQRLATTDEARAAIAAKIAAWDAYAVALCNLPEQSGAPWPGGDIPWPVMPAGV